jgi:DNA/RNA endonuclease YhcR with UshA esterase domain
MSKRQRSTLEFCCTDSATSAVEDQSEEERKRKLAVRKSCIDSMGLQGSVYDLQGVPSSTAENTRIQDEDGAITPDPHQMFVLSSGRPSSTEGIFMICMLLNFFLWSSSSLSSHQQTKIA